MRKEGGGGGGTAIALSGKLKTSLAKEYLQGKVIRADLHGEGR